MTEDIEDRNRNIDNILPKISLFKAEFEAARVASAEFPFVLTPDHLRDCTRAYAKIIERESDREVCGDCGRLTNKYLHLESDDPVFIKYAH